MLMLAVLALASGNALGGIVTGVVTSLESGQSLPSTTIRVEGTGRSMIANADGRYRLRLDPGTYELRFSHVAHHSQTRTVTVAEDEVTLDVVLERAMIELPGTRVYERNYDAAQEIIIQAINRKEAILNKLSRYSFDAYTRVVVYDTLKTDSETVFLIAESQLSCFWERPDKFAEVIKARKQTANIEAEGNQLSVGQVLNFNQDRLDLGPVQIISPTAHDALDHYNYYLVDTLVIDGRKVFRLEVEPQNENEPLFVGTMDIIDSTFEVVGIDVGFSRGIDSPWISAFRYIQHHAEFDDNYWMPVEIRFAFVIDPNIPGLSVYSIDYVAALHSYHFEEAHPAGRFDYVLEVAPEADDIDSAAWHAGQIVPLTPVERRGYAFRDSLKAAPKPLWKKALGGALAGLSMALNPDFFRFNRVEGAYVGLGFREVGIGTRLTLDARYGYATSSEFGQHAVGASYRLWQKRRLDLTARHHYTTRLRPTLNGGADGNATISSLFFKQDSYDYFREKGFHVGLGADIVKPVRLEFAYHDLEQSSEIKNTDYAFFEGDKHHRDNPSIADGRLRSISATLDIATRSYVKTKGRVTAESAYFGTRLLATVEYASPDFIDSDFDFLRYAADLTGRWRLAGLGTTQLRIAAGASDRNLPPQRYFAIDGGGTMLGDMRFASELGFVTLGDHAYVGNRAAMVYASHEFDRMTLRASDIPLIRDIPWDIEFHGGVFWTDFDDHQPHQSDKLLAVAGKPYSEAGIRIGGLLPFFLKLSLTFQLSDYGTNEWSWGIGF